VSKAGDLLVEYYTARCRDVSTRMDMQVGSLSKSATRRDAREFARHAGLSLGLRGSVSRRC
jgi:hypothetical protein